MKEIINISGVDGYLDENDVVMLNLEHVAKGLGFTRTANSGNEVIRWERVNKYLTEFGVPTCGHGEFIPEPVFYMLAMKADNAVAREFQKLVAYEILPSIRKNGGYIKNQESLSDDEIIANALIVAQKVIASQKARLEEQKPLVQFAEIVTKSKDNILMRDMAKLLCDEGLNIGEKRLYRYLRNNGVLMQDNMPYQSYVDRQYFVVKENPINTIYGVKLTKTTLVTPKGQMWIVSKIKEEMESR